jgi:hypothetical protein
LLRFLTQADRFIVEVAPIDYGPVLLLMPFGFHLTMDTLPSGKLLVMASGPPWLVSGFRFRARLGFVIPSTFSGPRGVTPAFGYSAPHSSARGTLTLLNNALLSTPYGLFRPWAPLPYSRPRGSSTCGFSVPIGVPGSHVPLDRLWQAQATLMPDAAPVRRQAPPKLIPRQRLPRGFDIIPTLSTRHQWFPCGPLLASHLTWFFPGLFLLRSRP